MRARIAAVLLATAGIAASTTVPALAAPAPAVVSPPACMAVAGRPCVWQDRDSEGVVGRAQIAADQDELTLARVEVKLQSAWGSPWETVASSTVVRTGSISVSTPRIVTGGQRAIVCATGGPALDASRQITTCTAPY